MQGVCKESVQEAEEQDVSASSKQSIKTHAQPQTLEEKTLPEPSGDAER